MDKTPEKTLAANLRWLMENTPGLGSQAAVADRAKKMRAGLSIDQKTVGRILAAAHPPQLDKIAGLALAFGVSTWQLLAPRLGADLYKIGADRRIVPVIEKAPPAAEEPPSRLTPEGRALLDFAEGELSRPAPAKATKKTAAEAHDAASTVRAPKRMT